MPDIFINLDASYLVDLANQLQDVEGEDVVIIEASVGANGLKARLLQIAQHLQGLDDASALQYQLGRRHMEAEIFARSNVLANPAGEDEKGREIIARIEALNATPVRRIPLGVRALEDKPHQFNAPVRKAPKPVERDEVQAKLDLSILIDL